MISKKLFNTRYFDLVVAGVFALLTTKMTYSWIIGAMAELDGKVYKISRLNLGVILFVILWDVYHLLAAYWIVKKQRNGLLLACLVAAPLSWLFLLGMFSPVFFFNEGGKGIFLFFLTYFSILLYTVKRLFLSKKTYQK